jgi:outer membrane immunogenic protein
MEPENALPPLSQLELEWGVIAMRKALAAAVAAFVLGASAQQGSAADLALKAPPRAVATASGWAGFYIGIEGGGDWGQFTQTNTITNVSLGTFKQQGALFGGTIGYNAQSGNIVYGLESDLSWTNLSGTQNCGPTRTNICTTDMRAIGTTRARLGVTVMPNALVYATGGLAYADIHATRDVGATESDNWRATWVLGVGAEIMIMPHLSLKGEYLYTDFPGVATTYVVNASNTPVAATEHNVQILRGGLNWHF